MSAIVVGGIHVRERQMSSRSAGPGVLYSDTQAMSHSWTVFCTELTDCVLFVDVK